MSLTPFTVSGKQRFGKMGRVECACLGSIIASILSASVPRFQLLTWAVLDLGDNEHVLGLSSAPGYWYTLRLLATIAIASNRIYWDLLS